MANEIPRNDLPPSDAARNAAPRDDAAAHDEARDACRMEEHGRAFDIPTVTVRLQPEETQVVFPRHKVKKVQRLLAELQIRPGTAIVARGQELLTPDRDVLPGDVLLVRKVTSSG